MGSMQEYREPIEVKIRTRGAKKFERLRSFSFIEGEKLIPDSFYIKILKKEGA